ncbi:MAG: HD domain-containing protein [Nitrospirae bacterium]|nr:HD domain-containing protein [Nitrospirota bacterium]
MDANFEEKGTEYGKLYQDQLYGTKVLTPLAVAIIDTPEFQRLSGMRQLGFSDITYRGATHTRFAHSIGTYLMTRTIMRRIAQNHERLGLKHPGEGLPDCFRIYPINAFPEKEEDNITTSNQALWRGLMEVVSIAALLHDIGHVPFGHTLEDEFVGIYDRHDKIGSPRLYEMLFNEQSDLKKIFGDIHKTWICTRSSNKGIPNDELAKLIYVILSWKEEINSPKDFDAILSKELEDTRQHTDDNKIKRLEYLRDWHKYFRDRGMFHPFMSDIIGNTICADLLDYLPRDRMNLGMEYRKHERLQRYLTIRPGSLYPNEGLRVSIMVTRPGRGGQRRDVATAVLDIMRERYEMAERVYYHHKKAAASAMLAKLVELSQSAKPSDDESIYPAPWTLSENNEYQNDPPRNVVHFSDSSFIDYFKSTQVSDGLRTLQQKLYTGILYRRKAMYRTLMEVDTDLIHLSSRPISYFSKDLREYDGKPSNEGRKEVEKELAVAAGIQEGAVLIYCPDPNMQSKEVNARLEIIENRVLPLRVQRESFTYQDDVRVLEQYYQELWRIYIFVSPEIFDQPTVCQAIVDKFCERYGIEKLVAYNKVRRHEFKLSYDVIARKAIEPLRAFFDRNDREGIPFNDTPQDIVSKLMARSGRDSVYLKYVKSGEYPSSRISSLFDIIILETEIKKLPKSSPKAKAVRKYISAIEAGNVTSRLKAARENIGSMFELNFDKYVADLVDVATTYISE